MPELTRAARSVKPDAVVWRGDLGLPLSQQGLKVLGIPIGQPAFVSDFLERKSREQQTLFQRIPAVNDPQAAFLLLLMCGSIRANFWMRAVRPEDSEGFATRHDENVWACLRELLGMPNAPPEARVIATLALSAGGLGLVSAVRVRPAAHWASWADSLRMIRQRHPLIARLIIAGLEEDSPLPCFRSVRQCQQTLDDAGLEMPPWQELSESHPARDEDPEPNQPKFGWQQRATRKLEERQFQSIVEVPAWSPRFSSIHCPPDFESNQGGRSTFPSSLVQTVALAPSPLHAHLPMWPPT